MARVRTGARCAAALLAWSLVVACSSDDPTPPGTTPAEPPPPPPGSFIEGPGGADEAWFRDRKLDYLRFETQNVEPASLVNTLSHVARRRLEPGYAPAGPPVQPDAFKRYFDSMDALEDGRDFEALYLTILLFSYGDDPYLAPATKTAIEEALARFKYWYTQPTPAGRTDDSYYWSENHQIIYHGVEYLMGTRLPDRPIGTDGRLGKEHAAEARTRILRWLEHRLRFGFAEWFSNVYYQKDITPLLMLIELAPDEEIRARASAVLDTLFFELSTHTMRDAFGVTHGRSYKKDKLKSLDEDTWGVTHLLFGRATYGHVRNDGGASVLAATSKYVLPEVIRRVGGDTSTMVDRERIGIPIHDYGPIEADPVGAYGFSYTDEKDLMVWWGCAALTAYPVVPLTIETFNRYNLWDNKSFADLRSFKPLASSPDFAKNLAAIEANKLNFGILKQVDTYTYRNSEVMLSSAIDYRKGSFNQQMHSWQATIDAKALVFTNHPFRPLATTGDWRDDPENGGYWNGEATAPRSVQHQNVGIHIYAPQYAKTNSAPFDYFRWEPYTHAYFPQDYFDEVVQKGNWTFGRLGKGYIGLYSWRAPKFLVYDGTTQATDGRLKPFDLRADGGADNVWIVEVAREDDAGPFAAWQNAVSSAELTVVDKGSEANGVSRGFDVVYTSPSQGRITFGWEAPLVVKGAEVPLAAPGRFDNPYAKVPVDPTEIVATKDGFGFRLDVKNGRRTLFGPR
ncbi:MAG: hypothetical protein JST00_04870 [Deltaproteobacteria bacterium]|nr:hypothetical protein [Deltaproteobacteria bacterium]